MKIEGAVIKHVNQRSWIFSSN